MDIREICIPKQYEKLFQPKRLKIMFGGRGGCRTETVARALIMMATQRPIRVWCAREIQKNIDQSVKATLEQIIKIYKLEEYFNITGDEITAANGSYFMFKGFQGSGGRYSEDELKAFAYIDILWLEEAAAIKQESLNTVDATIRKGGSEIWATFNRRFEDDAIWQYGCYGLTGAELEEKKFYEDENRIIIYSNLDDNPFAHETTLPRSREMDKGRLSQAEWEHKWLGRPYSGDGALQFFPNELIDTYHDEPDFKSYSRFERVGAVDPNGGGEDGAVAVMRQGGKIISIHRFPNSLGKDPIRLASAVLEYKRSFGCKKMYCDIGYGAGILTLAASMGERIIPITFGASAINNDMYFNRRAEIYGLCRTWLQNGGFICNKNHQFNAIIRKEMRAIKYNARKTDEGRICLNAKDDIRKEIGKSPDFIDAIAMTFGGGGNDKLEKNDDGSFIDDNDYSVDDIPTSMLIKY